MSHTHKTDSKAASDRFEIDVDTEKIGLLTLTGQEREIFAEAMLNPPAPNPALRRATKRYGKMLRR